MSRVPTQSVLRGNRTSSTGSPVRATRAVRTSRTMPPPTQIIPARMWTNKSNS
jgi:hypothetical protein